MRDVGIGVAVVEERSKCGMPERRVEVADDGRRRVTLVAELAGVPEVVDPAIEVHDRRRRVQCDHTDRAVVAVDDQVEAVVDGVGMFGDAYRIAGPHRGAAGEQGAAVDLVLELVSEIAGPQGALMFDRVLDEHDGIGVERQQVVGDLVDPIVSVEQVHRRDADSLRSFGDRRLIGDEDDRPCEHQTTHPDQRRRERDPDATTGQRDHGERSHRECEIWSERLGDGDRAKARQAERLGEHHDPRAGNTEPADQFDQASSAGVHRSRVRPHLCPTIGRCA